MTALREFQQDNVFLPPGLICQYEVSGLVVADLSAGYDPAQWDPLWQDHACDWRELLFNRHVTPPTWYMADEAIEAGCQGILFPSQAHPGGMNLVVFDSSTLPASALKVIDPSGALPHSQSSWAD